MFALLLYIYKFACFALLTLLALIALLCTLCLFVFVSVVHWYVCLLCLRCLLSPLTESVTCCKLTYKAPKASVARPWPPAASRGLPWPPVAARGLPWSPLRALPLSLFCCFASLVFFALLDLNALLDLLLVLLDACFV